MLEFLDGKNSVYEVEEPFRSKVIDVKSRLKRRS